MIEGGGATFRNSEQYNFYLILQINFVSTAQHLSLYAVTYIQTVFALNFNQIS